MRFDLYKLFAKGYLLLSPQDTLSLFFVVIFFALVQFSSIIMATIITWQKVTRNEQLDLYFLDLPEITLGTSNRPAVFNFGGDEQYLVE